jgi:NADH dehydrogenase [ubiquinone] 1 alpha subcomplex assembly factor 7
MMERLDAFMARANAAYYATHDPFADFTTAPEISQVFGEILGLWAAVTWQGLGAPDPVLLVEAGPGRGTLMADALRAIGRAVPAFRTALRLHLIETSPRLRAVQEQLLKDAEWHDGLDTIPQAPLILLGNEFLDALPIRQFVRRENTWTERFVEDGKFVEMAISKFAPAPIERGGWGEGFVPESGCDSVPADPSPQPPPTRGVGVDVACPDTTTIPEGTIPEGTIPDGTIPDGTIPDGTIRERNNSATTVVTTLARRFLTHPGAALFLDYGPAASAFGDSLQALRAGRPAAPLSPPGTADLTAHVDFAALATAAQTTGAAVHGPLPQGLFLARLGLFQRTGVLARGQPPARAAALMQAASRLAEPARMGRLFKALAVSSPDAETPPGFA